jgi:uncharacterized glyoxalase superfamily protein PhnB
MPVHFESTIPILRIFSIEKAREFYLDYLGFTVDFEHRFDSTAPLYMQVSRGGLLLHLSEHYGDACPGAAVLVWMTGLDELHAEVTAKNYPYMRPGIELAPWGARVMNVKDPFGNRVMFTEQYDPDTATQTA